MTRNFVSFIRFVVFVVVVSFGTLSLAGCNNPAAPTPPGGGSGGQGVQMDPLPPGSPAPTDIPSGPVQFKTYGGQSFPATAEILHLSPEPRSLITRGVVGDCEKFPNRCFQQRVKACIDTSQYTWPGAEKGNPPFGSRFSNQEGGYDTNAYLGEVVSGPDSNGCWVFDSTMSATGGTFKPFPPPEVTDCCQWLNITVSWLTHPIGEEPNWDGDDRPVAYAPFFLYYH